MIIIYILLISKLALLTTSKQRYVCKEVHWCMVCNSKTLTPSQSQLLMLELLNKPWHVSTIDYCVIIRNKIYQYTQQWAHHEVIFSSESTGEHWKHTHRPPTEAATTVVSRIGSGAILSKVECHICCFKCSLG